MLSYALIAAALVSLVSFSGAFALTLRQHALRKVLLFFVAFSAGTMMAGALFHLLPEAITIFGVENLTPFVLLIGGFATFFLLERFVFWHHCHASENCPIHSLGYMNLVGDGIHNFLDGLVIAAAFATDVSVGIATTLAIISHEIPQEISDFGVLIHAGMKPWNALAFNFFSAIFAILGVLVGGMLGGRAEYFEPFLLAFTAGGFIYIAASDLVPELHKEKNLRKASVSFVMFVLGIGLMLGLKVVMESGH